MFKSTPRLISILSLLAWQAPAQALKPATQGEPYVEHVSIKPPSPAAVVTLQNTSASPYADQVSLAPQSPTLRLAMGASVKCIKDKQVEFSHARAYFGPATMSGGDIDSSQTLHSAAYDPSFTVWDGVGNGQWNSEAGNASTFDVPLDALKNGPNNIAFDPVAEFQQRLDQHVAKGGDRLQFLQQPQTFTIGRVVSLGGWCRKDGTSRSGVNSVFAAIQVRYPGQPDLKNKPQLNAQLGGVPAQGINQNLPMQLNSATFQPNMPDHVGSCPPAQDPIIRVNYSGSGKGWVRFSIVDGSAVHGTGDIAFDSTQGPAHFDFAYPLKAKLVSRPQWAEVNKTFQHHLVIRAKYRDAQSNEWSDWSNYGSALWNHRCTPSLNVVPFGQQGGKVQAPGQPTPGPADPSPLVRRPIEASPAASVPGGIQAPRTPRAPARLSP